MELIESSKTFLLGLELSKSLEMLTMLLVLEADFLSEKYGSRIVKRVQETQEKVFQSFPLVYLTRQCTFVPSMLISLTLKVPVQKFFLAASPGEKFFVFRIDSGFS
jgi:hypothetical protein